MVLETIALLSGVKELFMFNRQSYSFNKTLDQERLYHLQKMRMDQVKLYRDDIQDLFGLVQGKMNNYYLINTLTLGFSLGFYYEGRLPSDVPSWLYWLWAMSLGTAIVYLFLSVWFAVHANVIAQMFSTRILTQWLRLPVPGPPQIDAAAPKLEEFEKAPVNQQLRVPMLSSKVPTQKDVVVGSEGGPNRTDDPPTTQDPLIQEGYNYYLGHFYMYGRLQKHWMSLDAYCRVCMVVGCNQILNVVTYTGLAYFTLMDSQWGTISFVVIPIVFACIHAQIHLLLSKKEAVFFLFVHSLAPLSGSIAAALQMVYTNDNQAALGATVAQYVALGSYICHLMSASFLLYLGLDLHNGLPTRFTTVNYIDVLGLNQKSGSPNASTRGLSAENVSHLSKPVTTFSALRSQLSSRLNDLIGSARRSTVSVTEKEQPPISQVVPPAASIRRADTMYQTLVAEKRRSSIQRTNTEGQLTVGGMSTLDGVRPSLRKSGTSSSFRSSGPDDYIPTQASLQTPDVLAKMPYVAYRTVGSVTIILWFCGIFFSCFALWSSIDIGWTNRISPHTTSNTTNAARRLSTDFFNIPSPARYMQVTSVECLGTGFVVADGVRRYRVNAMEIKSYDCRSNFGICTVTARENPVQVNRVADRKYTIVSREFGDLSVVIPISLASEFSNPTFSFHADTQQVLATGAHSLIAWDSQSGRFQGLVEVPCATNVIRDIFSVCPQAGSRITAVFRSGDSCSFSLI